jgi:hypothetical protein
VLSLSGCTRPDVLDYRRIVASAQNLQLKDTAEFASRARRAQQSFTILIDEQSKLDMSDPVRILESVRIFGGDHAFVLLALRPSAFLLITNVLPTPTADGGFLVSEPGDVQVFEVSRSADREQWFAETSPTEFIQGVTGNPRKLDGETFMLVARDRSVFTQLIVHGAEFAPWTDADPLPTDEPDKSRYEAIQAVLNIWFDALKSQPTPQQTLSVQ